MLILVGPILKGPQKKVTEEENNAFALTFVSQNPTSITHTLLEDTVTYNHFGQVHLHSSVVISVLSGLTSSDSKWLSGHCPI